VGKKRVYKLKNTTKKSRHKATRQLLNRKVTREFRVYLDGAVWLKQKKGRRGEKTVSAKGSKWEGGGVTEKRPTRKEMAVSAGGRGRGKRILQLVFRTTEKCPCGRKGEQNLKVYKPEKLGNNGKKSKKWSRDMRSRGQGGGETVARKRRWKRKTVWGNYLGNQ